MNIEIKKSIKPIKYTYAIKKMEDRLEEILKKNKKELIWILEHEEVYTGGTSYKDTEILDKSINFIKTNRGGKITYHGPGQLIFYLVLDLRKRGKNIKKLLTVIENSIIETLDELDIKTFDNIKNTFGNIKYDVIIDDGLHSIGANLNTLLFALNNIKINGWIVIEDIHIPDNWFSIDYILSKNKNIKTYIIKASGGYLFCVKRLC